MVNIEKISFFTKLLAGIWIAFFMFAFIQGKPIQGKGQNIYQPKILIFINLKDLMCSNCLDSFSRFCRSLPPHLLKENTIGILIGEKMLFEEKRWKVLAKKLRGFIQANQLSFPVWIDHLGVFKNLSEWGTSILVMGYGVNSFRLYSLPLFPDQENEIRQEIMGLDGKDKKE